MRCIFMFASGGIMRSYRMYETVDPDHVITEDDFFLASQRMEKIRLSNIVENVKKLILSRDMQNCRSVKCFHHHDEDLRIRRSYEVAIIIKSLMFQAIESGAENVTLITELSDDRLIINVLDDGQKISEDARRLLFAPKVKADGDSYLRFYNVRKAVIRCKGKMKLDEDRNGNIFTVSLPAAEVIGPDFDQP